MNRGHRAQKGKNSLATATIERQISLPQIEIRKLQITLIGDSPLISHKWSDKAKKMMLDKQMKQANTGKEAKNPEQDFLDSLYPLPGGKGYGFPCVAFKSAAVSACRFVDGAKMTEARGAFHVQGELSPILGDPPTPREDMVRIGMGTADIRYRGEFKNWRTTLDITYNARAISEEQVVNLFQVGGFGVGVGEWRPEKDGSYGRFHVATQEEL